MYAFTDNSPDVGCNNSANSSRAATDQEFSGDQELAKNCLKWREDLELSNVELIADDD